MSSLHLTTRLFQGHQVTWTTLGPHPIIGRSFVMFSATYETFVVSLLWRSDLICWLSFSLHLTSAWPAEHFTCGPSPCFKYVPALVSLANFRMSYRPTNKVKASVHFQFRFYNLHKLVGNMPMLNICLFPPNSMCSSIFKPSPLYFC